VARIIKRGTTAEDYRYLYVHAECGSEIEFTKADVKSDTRDGDYVECPVCGRFISWEVVQRHSQKKLKGDP
jgi:DNA-directed RNA polymerase subunit RPC12/RpoP